MRSLSSWDSMAEVEFEAVFNQLEDTMTPEQLEAISKIELNGADMVQLMADLGISFGFGGPGLEILSPDLQATAETARDSGEVFPGRGFSGNRSGGGNSGSSMPGGSFMGGQGPGHPLIFPGNMTPDQQATKEAFRAERGNAGFWLSLVFVDPLIELLQGSTEE